MSARNSSARAAGMLGALFAAGALALVPSGPARAGRVAPDSRSVATDSRGVAPTAGSVTTDSGRPAISWTWTKIAPAPGKPRGYLAFQRACWVCHGSGPAKPGTRALRAKYRGKIPAPLEQRTDLTAAYVKYIVRHGVSVMPPFRKTELSDADLNSIATYLGRQQTAPKRTAR